MHTHTIENKKTSAKGLPLNYVINVRKLNKPVPQGYLGEGKKYIVTGQYKKPCGKSIYNSTEKFFNTPNEAMIAYAKLIKKASK